MPPTHEARPLRASETGRTLLVHYLQMLAAMAAGMVTLGPLTTLVNSDSVVVDALMMATTMTAGMTAWMVWKRHGGPAIGEMAAAMYGSFAALFPAYWLGALPPDALLLGGHLLMFAAMALAMLRRRNEYSRG